jgi:4-methyl-5(b-hydroxyethyl)-thiazole monophosphate biosynthesis
MLKIAVLVANGSEDMEVIVPIDLWRRAGIRVDLISIERKKICILSNGNKVSADTTMDKVNLSQYNALYLPGGPGHTKFKEDKKVASNILKFNTDKKWLFAICAAPSVYGDMGILENVKYTGFPGTEKSFKGTYQKVKAIADKHFITGRGPGAVFEFALLVVEKLINKNKVTELSKETQFTLN